jgi:hypothetical protein
VADAIRAIGVTEATYYRWRQEFGGLKLDHVKRLRELKVENTRLRKLDDAESVVEARTARFVGLNCTAPDLASSG